MYDGDCPSWRATTQGINTVTLGLARNTRHLIPSAKRPLWVTVKTIQNCNTECNSIPAVPYGLYHIISSDYITLYHHIISHYITLYHIISHYIITLYHHIISHIVSHYITLYHFISYYIILYHIISYYII